MVHVCLPGVFFQVIGSHAAQSKSLKLAIDLQFFCIPTEGLFSVLKNSNIVAQRINHRSSLVQKQPLQIVASYENNYWMKGLLLVIFEF